jgi:hypothetical protein
MRLLICAIDICEVPNVYLPKLAQQLALTGRAKDAVMAYKRQTKSDLSWEELESLLESMVIGTKEDALTLTNRIRRQKLLRLGDFFHRAKEKLGTQFADFMIQTKTIRAGHNWFSFALRWSLGKGTSVSGCSGEASHYNFCFF